MAKKKPAKKAKANQGLGFSKLSEFKKFLLHHKTLGILLIIVGIWALVWLGQAGVERYNFYRIENKLDILSTNIDSGSESKSNVKTRTCNYSGVPFGKGTLRCSIYITQRVVVISIKDANQKAKNYIKKFSHDESVDSQTMTNNGKFAFTRTDFESSSTLHEIQRNFKFKDLNQECWYILRPVFGSIQGFDVLVGCTSKAKLPYFPVQN